MGSSDAVADSLSLIFFMFFSSLKIRISGAAEGVIFGGETVVLEKVLSLIFKGFLAATKEEQTRLFPDTEFIFLGGV